MLDAVKAEVFAIATERKNRRALVVAVAVIRTDLRGSLSQRVFPLMFDRLAAEMHDALKFAFLQHTLSRGESAFIYFLWISKSFLFFLRKSMNSRRSFHNFDLCISILVPY